jgi:hypothetical protein
MVVYADAVQPDAVQPDAVQPDAVQPDPAPPPSGTQPDDIKERVRRIFGGQLEEPAAQPLTTTRTSTRAAAFRLRRIITAVVIAVFVAAVVWALQPVPLPPPLVPDGSSDDAGTGSDDAGTGVTVIPDLPAALNKQADALEHGDLQAWLDPVDTKSQSLRDRYTALFRRLRALGVHTLQPILAGADTDCCTETIYYGVCVQTDDCGLVGYETAQQILDANLAELFAMTISWREDGSPDLITGMTLLAPDKVTATEPLLTDATLQTGTGQRVVVAAAADEAGHLAETVRQADAAAAVADTFTDWRIPQRYVVYLADPKEWRTWFGGEVTAGELGYEYDNTRSSAIVVVNISALPGSGVTLRQVLQHEFGHVVTLFGLTHRGDDDVLTEGMAEYVEENGQPVSRYYRIDDVRSYLQSHSWNGNPDSLDKLIGGDDASADSAAYGIGYLTWRCIATTYGQAKMTAFAFSTVHYGDNHDTAARKALGVPWASVNAACAAYIRNA